MITISDKPHNDFIKDKDAMIQAAVDYWAQYLTKGDLGVDREQSGIGAVLMAHTRLQNEPHHSDDKVAKFKEVLTAKLNRQFEGMDKHKKRGRIGYVSISTDYGPEGILRDACDESGAWANFPLKDNITIDFDSGKVERRQVRGSTGILYQADLSGVTLSDEVAPGVDINEQLLEAVEKDNVGKVRNLLEAGANANFADPEYLGYGRTPLMIAGLRGNFEIAEMLLKADPEAGIRATSKNGEGALYFAAHGHNPQIVKMLIDAGADVNAVSTESDKTPLMAAVSHGTSYVADDKKDQAKQDTAEVVALLLKAGAEADASNKRGQTALFEAAYNDYEGATRLLLEAGADPNKTGSYDGRVPLEFPVRWGHAAVAKILLEHGAKPISPRAVGYSDGHGNHIPQETQEGLRQMLTDALAAQPQTGTFAERLKQRAGNGDLPPMGG